MYDPSLLKPLEYFYKIINLNDVLVCTIFWETIDLLIFFASTLDIDVWITHAKQLNFASISSTWPMLPYMILIIVFL